MDRIAAARGAFICFRFDLVELRRCCNLRRRLAVTIIMGQLKRMDARTYIHERWASRTWPANMFKLYTCTH